MSSLPTETLSEGRTSRATSDASRASPVPLSRIQQVATQQTPEAKAAREAAKSERASKDLGRRLNEEKRTGVFNPYQRVEDNVVSGGKTRTRRRKHKKTKKAKKSLRRKRN